MADSDLGFLDKWFREYGEVLAKEEARLLDNLIMGEGVSERPYGRVGRQTIGDWLALGSEVPWSATEAMEGIVKQDVIKVVTHGDLSLGVELSPELAAAARKLLVVEHPSFFGAATYEGAWTETTSDPAAPSASNLTMEKLLETARILRQQAIERPFLQEIWFVDEVVGYLRFKDAFENYPSIDQGELAPDAPYRPLPSLAGIPIHTWDGRAAIDSCKTEGAMTAYLAEAAHVPLCGLVPGIWLKLSDGRVQQVADVADLIAALKASASPDNSG